MADNGLLLAYWEMDTVLVRDTHFLLLPELSIPGQCRNFKCGGFKMSDRSNLVDPLKILIWLVGSPGL
jgi:hypothetical protein